MLKVYAGSWVVEFWCLSWGNLAIQQIPFKYEVDSRRTFIHAIGQHDGRTPFKVRRGVAVAVDFRQDDGERFAAALQCVEEYSYGWPQDEDDCEKGHRLRALAGHPAGSGSPEENPARSDGAGHPAGDSPDRGLFGPVEADHQTPARSALTVPVSGRRTGRACKTPRTPR